MKVILKQDVENLGDAGEIVDVADGYGNNYLMPHGLAMRASKGALADAEAIARTRAKREARNVEEAEQLKGTLEGKLISIPAKAGADGTLYGSVGNAMIAEAVKEQTGHALDRRKVVLDKPLKSVGEHEVTAKIHGDVTATLRVVIIRGEGSAEPGSEPEPAEDEDTDAPVDEAAEVTEDDAAE
jgi:large subunit ribosomal protein L9